MPIPVIIPPDPITDPPFRYDGCYQSMVIVTLQRILDASGGGGANPQLQEIIDELTELNGKVATEATLEAARVLLASLNAKDFATETTLAAIGVLINSLDGKDYSTETTLDAVKTAVEAIQSVTDQMAFTADKLKTTGEDGGGGGGGVSVFGDSGGYANLTPDGTNQLVLAADTDFKEVILYHENKKQGWIKFGGGAAVVGEGFPIKKKQPWILDRCRDEIRIIFEGGFDAKDLQINTVKL